VARFNISHVPSTRDMNGRMKHHLKGFLGSFCGCLHCVFIKYDWNSVKFVLAGIMFLGSFFMADIDASRTLQISAM